MTVKCHLVRLNGGSLFLGNPYIFATVPRVGEGVAIQQGHEVMRYKVTDVLNIEARVDGEPSVSIMVSDA